MAGYVPNQTRARIIEALVGKTTLASGTVYLGLATQIPADPFSTTLATLTEVTTAGYARVAIPTFDPASTTSPVQITTPTSFLFPAFTENMDTPANYAFITDAANGTNGLVRYVFEVPQPILGRIGEPVAVAANTLIIE